MKWIQNWFSKGKSPKRQPIGLGHCLISSFSTFPHVLLPALAFISKKCSDPDLYCLGSVLGPKGIPYSASKVVVMAAIYSKFYPQTRSPIQWTRENADLHVHTAQLRPLKGGLGKRHHCNNDCNYCDNKVKRSITGMGRARFSILKTTISVLCSILIKAMLETYVQKKV